MSVELNINGVKARAEIGISLFDAAEQAGQRVPTSCGKQGNCRECLVEVVAGDELLTPRTYEEQRLRNGFRLACRARVAAGSGLIKCHTLRRGRMQIVQEPSDQLSIGTRRFDPAVTRKGSRVLLDEKPIDYSEGPLYGLAVDVGTTTVVVRMLDLETGSILRSTSFENPQRFGGSDVMSRIQFDGEQPDRILQRTLVGYLNHAIEEMRCDPRAIYEVVIAGNTTMRDLLFGVDVRTVGRSPFQSRTEIEMRRRRRKSTILNIKADKLGLLINPRARVTSLPLIGSHVGADTAACLLAIDLPHEDRLVAMMDIGTNTELVIGNRHRAVAASCPAGPAFEGCGLSCGMPALDGAIERIRLNGDEIITQVIGREKPAGICGSGLVDLLSELLRTNRMTLTGRLNDGVPNPFVVDHSQNVALSESDISRLAQAKAANVAGLRILMRRRGIDFSRIDRFYLAGGFARHLDLDAARRIGLAPDIDDSRLVRLGNAAIEGATIALLSVSRRAEIEQLARSIEHVELEEDPQFFDHFVEGLMFQPVRLAGES